MKKLLRQIGLLDSFTTELKASPQEFVTELNKITDKGDISSENSKKEYIGLISENKFEISRRSTNIMSIGHAKAYGKMKQEGEKLIIDVDIYFSQAYSVLFGFSFVTLMFIFLGLVALVVSISEGEYQKGILGAAAFWGFTLLFIGGPLYVMRHVVSDLWLDVKIDLENIGKKKRFTT